MASTRLSTKGQLIIPRPILDRLDWPPGTRLEIDVRGDRVVLRRPTAVPRCEPEEAYGCLAWDGPPLSVENLDEAVTAEARRRRAGLEH